MVIGRGTWALRSLQCCTKFKLLSLTSTIVGAILFQTFSLSDRSWSYVRNVEIQPSETIRCWLYTPQRELHVTTSMTQLVPLWDQTLPEPGGLV